MSAQPVEVTTMDAPKVTIHVGDCRDVLKTLPAKSVHCVVTSPPYFNLRDYGSGQWEGGDPACEHRVEASSRSARPLGLFHGGDDEYVKSHYRDVCGRCGARRVDRQIGLEADVAAYVAALMDVFAEVWRVLRDDGSMMLNLGDSFAGSGQGPQGGINRRPDDTTPGGGKGKKRSRVRRYRLRSDLTNEQIAYVLQELAAARKVGEVGLPDLAPGVDQAITTLAGGE